ncbi:hypothetical protein M3484_17365 [Pseudomonas sp. GX19020]|uniref:hypothetical protein n=1 Tax=Pseudomonas sp. GX19020 TaxID=2942277 RepID=UPI0020191DDC|nr:hypothetical protein [Pseudomonas sp. GX19020]MCL4068338.1 hypothetical protein [Pseudomonas sp. GX19020]
MSNIDNEAVTDGDMSPLEAKVATASDWLRTSRLMTGLFRLKPCPPATQLRQLASEVMAHEYLQTASVAQVAS